MSTKRPKKVDLDNNNHTSSPTNKSREKKSGKGGNDEILLRNGKTAAVLVVGDAGRSPRMQYHTLSLANIAGMERVYLVGFSGNYICRYTYLNSTSILQWYHMDISTFEWNGYDIPLPF